MARKTRADIAPRWLQEIVRSRVIEYIEQAVEVFGREFRRPKVEFTTRGATAGRCRPWEGLNFNPTLLMAHPESFLASAVPHEVAHWICHYLHGADHRPHGAKWVIIMDRLGVKDITARHSYEVTENRPHVYVCSCAGGEREHRLTTKRHRRRDEDGEVPYRCRDCKVNLSYIRTERNAGPRVDWQGLARLQAAHVAPFSLRAARRMLAPLGVSSAEVKSQYSGLPDDPINWDGHGGAVWVTFTDGSSALVPWDLSVSIDAVLGNLEAHDLQIRSYISSDGHKGTR